MSNVFADFLINKGLYDTIEVTKENIDELCELVDGKVRISIYCMACKEHRVFSMEPLLYGYHIDETRTQESYLGQRLQQLQTIQRLSLDSKPGETTEKRDWFWKNRECAEAVRVMVFSYRCSMDSNHTIDYIVQTDGNQLRKIGQYPSIADLSFSELKEYRKVTDETDLRELKRAVGLYAQGIGVGAYVYLRRIFERIIVKAGKKAVEDGKIEQSTFDRARMDDKIKMLKEYLPKILCETPAFYGIVSKGIHELSEQECINYFPVVQEAILMILREWEDKRKAAESEKKIKMGLSDIASNIS